MKPNRTPYSKPPALRVTCCTAAASQSIANRSCSQQVCRRISANHICVICVPALAQSACTCMRDLALLLTWSPTACACHAAKAPLRGSRHCKKGILTGPCLPSRPTGGLGDTDICQRSCPSLSPAHRCCCSNCWRCCYCWCWCCCCCSWCCCCCCYCWCCPLLPR